MKYNLDKKEKMVKLKLDPPLWIEDWGGDAITFELDLQRPDPCKK